MTNWKAWLAVGGIVSLVAGWVALQGESPAPTISLANMTFAQKDSVVIAEVSAAKPGEEIISNRLPNLKTFKGYEPGKMINYVYTASQHYLDPADSVYKSIDLTVHNVSEDVKDNSDRLFDNYVDAGNYRSTWFIDEPHNYTFYVDDHYVKYTALFDTTGITIRTVLQNGGVKQTIVLRDSVAVTSLSWLIETNAFMGEAIKGAITFTDDAEVDIFYLSTPTASYGMFSSIPVTVIISGDTLTYKLTVPENVKYPIEVDPSTKIVGDTAANTGHLYDSNATYSTVRGDVDAASVEPYISVLNLISGGLYYVGRGPLYFGSPGIAEAIIDSVKICMEDSVETIATDYYILLVEGTFSGALAGTQFNDFTGWNGGGATPYAVTVWADSFSTADYAVSDTVRIKLNADGLTGFNKAAANKYMLVSKGDRDSTAPSDISFIRFAKHSVYMKIWYTAVSSWGSVYGVANVTKMWGVTVTGGKLWGVD